MVRLDGGGELPYDGLVIASGSRAKRLAADGAADRNGTAPPGSSRCAPSRMRSPSRNASPRPSVLVIGGGPLGMEVASGCLHVGCEVTLVSDATPLSRQLGDHLADIFTSAAIRRGLRVVGGGKARLVIPTPGAGSSWPTAPSWRRTSWSPPSATSRTSSGWPARTSSSTGRCASTRAAGSGRTSSPPATWRPSRPAAGVQRIPLWTSAIDQAKVAAVGLLQGDAAPEFNFQPYFWTEGFGLSLKSVGFTPVVGTPDYCEPGEGTGLAAASLGKPGRFRHRRCDQLPDPHPQTAPAGRRRSRGPPADRAVKL